jgi:Ca2+-binding EF-hand superfamily protein
VYSAHQEELHALRLYERETDALYKIFKSIDKNGIGWIRIKSLFDLIEVEESNFTRTVFSVFDKENTGYICFRDFFVIIWNICTMAVIPLGLSPCPPPSPPSPPPN